MKEFQAFIRVLAEQSGEVIRPYFGRKDLDVERKSDASPVTKADREAEALIRDLIHKNYPNHGVIGEEYGSENPDAEFVWAIDPIDGTISFVHGCPLFGTLIALLHNNNPVIGVIHQPILKQLCVGDNTQTILNDQKVMIREVSDLTQATLLATDVNHIAKYHDAEGFELLRNKVRLFRTWGDCYGYLLLAGGNADIMLDAIMNPWDIYALVPIIRGAGGEISSWSGGDPVKEKSCVAASKSLHGKVIDALNAGRYA